MKNTIWGKHIPTLLGIGIITIGIALTSFLVKNGTIFIGQASPTDIPQNVKITNISDTSFTISYKTKEDSIGSVNFGKDKNLGQAAFDLRDQKQDLTLPHKIHMITVKNLTPETRYYFSIASGQKLFLDNDVPFEISTGPTIKDQPSPEVSLQGYVILPDGSKPKETIVYATTEGSQVISTIMKEDGSYLLSLNTMRSSDLSSYPIFSQDSKINILIENETLKSNVSVSPFQQTLPTITLSNNYDFVASSTSIATESAEFAEFIGFPSISITEESGSASSSPKIILPKKDQEFSDQKPQFTGTALPNETVTITIHSPEEIKTQVTADANGNWKYRPTSSITPGQHTITITTRDVFGILKTITQSFTVYAQGTQVNQSATPSATPTLAILPTRTPTPTPTKTLALANTPTPTSSLTTTPTLTLTPVPTFSATSVSTTSSAPIPTIASPGNSFVLTVGILGFATAAIGHLLFLLTRKGF